MIETTIHYEIMSAVAQQLQTDLIDNIAVDDKALVGVVIEGPLLDSPDYEAARISVEVFENDPFNFDTWDWVDEPVDDMMEIGYGMTWRRRFTLMSRVLLVNSAENRADARKIASLVRSRIEKSLMAVDFSGLVYDNEQVSGKIFNENIRSKLYQSGGPESWDFELQTRFEIKTTKVYNS